MIPLHRLKKQELVWLATHRCQHGHLFIEHYNCYLKEHPDRERIGFLDIETSNLDADFGIIISYCIKVKGENKIYQGVINKDDLKRNEIDKRIVKKLVNDLNNFDTIVGFYSTRFDLPYIRTRALVCKIPFPNYGTIKHKDIYYISRNKLKLHSNRQESVCRTILGTTEKTHLISKYWIGALRGDEQSLRYILDHNKKDVFDLERIYDKLIYFVSPSNKSI